MSDEDVAGTENILQQEEAEMNGPKVAKKFFKRKSAGEKIVEKFRPLFVSSPKLASFRSSKKTNKKPGHTENNNRSQNLLSMRHSASLDLPSNKESDRSDGIQKDNENWASFDDETFSDKDRDDESSTFFDSLSRQWVKVNNFAFSEETNHFEKRNSNELDRSSESSFSIIDPNVIKENHFQVSAAEEKMVLKDLFNTTIAQQPLKLANPNDDISHVPKIVESPREDGGQISRPMKKLSDDIGILPTFSNPANTSVMSVDAAKTNIPRYVRKHSVKKISSTNCPVMKRKSRQLDEQQQLDDHSVDDDQRRLKNRSNSSFQIHRAKGMMSNKNLNLISKSEGHLNSVSYDDCVPLAGHKKEFNHVQSKVKKYIADVKEMSKSSKDLSKLSTFDDQAHDIRKSVGLTSLSKEQKMSDEIQTNMKKIKSYLDVSLLKDKVMISRREIDSLDRVDKTRISKLLDDLSDEDAVTEVEHDQEDAFSVEDVLVLALEERREKKEAEKVLSQLQTNYDILQRKYAEAENKIDNLRFRSNSRNEDYFLADSAFTEPNSSALASFAFGCENNLGHVDTTSRSFRGIDTNRSCLLDANTSRSYAGIYDNGYGRAKQNDVKYGSQKFHKNKKEKMDTLYDSISKLLEHPALSQNRTVQGQEIDQNFIGLLEEVGSRIRQMRVPKELQNSEESLEPEDDEDEDEDEQLSYVKDNEIVDPIKKVENWKVRQNSENRKAKNQSNGVGAISSCYGSLPTSPSPPALDDLNNKDPLSSRLFKPTSPPAAEFDSGYPGSDRSTKYYSLKGISPAISAKSGNDPKSGPRFLFNVEEEERSASTRGEMIPPQGVKASDLSESESSIPSDFEQSTIKEKKILAMKLQQTGLKNSIESNNSNTLNLPNMHRTYLHSVTDLSSDERSMFESGTPKGGNQFRKVVPSTSAAGEKLRYMKDEKSLKLEHELPSSALSSGRQPVALARQIDLEINELRNFYEDHKEEMMSLLNEYPNNGVPDNTTNHLVSRPTTETTKQKARKQWSLDSGTDVADLELERKKEFEKRRRAKRRSSSSQSRLPTSNNDSNHSSQLVPEFAIGDDQKNMISTHYSPKGHSSSYDNQHLHQSTTNNISSFFPPLKTPPDEVMSSYDQGRQIETDLGSIFIPRLNLDDAWTDEDKMLDAHSFDFHQSILSNYASIQQPQQFQHHGKEGQQVKHHHQSENSLHVESDDKVVRSQSLGDVCCHQSREQGGPVVIVQQSCCRSERPALDMSKKASAMLLSSSRSSMSMPPLMQAKPTSVRSRKRKSRLKKEMKCLLASLDQANKMASNLRQRSRDIVQVLGQEITKEEDCLFQPRKESIPFKSKT